MSSTIISFMAVASGGALGAMSRYGVGLLAVRVAGHGFPFATLSVNILGSFLMGVLIAVFASLWQPEQAIKLFLITGFLGAFTTFSAFSLDAVSLYERGEITAAALYITASVILSIAALFAGLFIVRTIIS